MQHCVTLHERRHCQDIWTFLGTQSNPPLPDDETLSEDMSQMVSVSTTERT